MGKKKNMKGVDELEMEFIERKMSSDSAMNYLTSEGLGTRLKALNFKLNVQCKNKKQKQFLKNLQDLDVKLNICDAPAGVGKSLLALTAGLYHLKNGNVSKIIIIVPTVEASEALKIGLLPGTIDDKIQPYKTAMTYTLEKILKISGNVGYKEEAQILINSGLVEFELLSYARGRTFDDSFIIIDEAENLSKRETLLLLGRMGEGNTKVVIIGDRDQCDRSGIKNYNDSGLIHAKNVLSGVEGVSIDEFGNEDIVRNTFITKIMDKW